jgi:hypothetical protein
LDISWNISYQDRYGETVGYNAEESSYYTTPYKPLCVGWHFAWNFSFFMFIEISNILDTGISMQDQLVSLEFQARAGLEVRL